MFIYDFMSCFDYHIMPGYYFLTGAQVLPCVFLSPVYIMSYSCNNLYLHKWIFTLYRDFCLCLIKNTMSRRTTIAVPMYASINSIESLLQQNTNEQNLEKFIKFKAKHFPLRSVTATRHDVNTRSTISLSTEFNSVTASVERYQS